MRIDETDADRVNSFFDAVWRYSIAGVAALALLFILLVLAGMMMSL